MKFPRVEFLETALNTGIKKKTIFHKGVREIFWNYTPKLEDIVDVTSIDINLPTRHLLVVGVLIAGTFKQQKNGFKQMASQLLSIDRFFS